ncbi:MAG: GNAT family N-acetyltransferase [Pseudomonadota bacterium]|nr:GNAT family N-acetyltransferase [Pseudomonadota bacterium]
MVSIRAARDPEDRAFIAGLNPRLTEVIDAPTHSLQEVEQFQAFFTETAWEQNAGSNAIFIAQDEQGEGIGYVNVREGIDDILNKPCAYIALLVLEKAYEGKGVAQALMQKAEEWAANAGYERLALDVFASNTRALSFYESAGFAQETTRLIKEITPNRP